MPSVRAWCSRPARALKRPTWVFTPQSQVLKVTLRQIIGEQTYWRAEVAVERRTNDLWSRKVDRRSTSSTVEKNSAVARCMVEREEVIDLGRRWSMVRKAVKEGEKEGNI